MTANWSTGCNRAIIVSKKHWKKLDKMPIYKFIVKIYDINVNGTGNMLLD